MKVIKILFHILGILAATLLSLSLAVTLFITPIVSTISSFLTAENFYKILKVIDYTDIFDATDAPASNPKLFNQLLDTAFAEDVITLYIDNLFEALENNNTEPLLTADDITLLAEKHFDTLLPIVRTHLGTNLSFTDEQVQTYAMQYISQTASELAPRLPSFANLGISDTALTILHTLYSGRVLRSLLLIISIFSFLILLCRFPKFKGFMWLGITYFCSALLLFLLAFMVKTTGISLFTNLVPISKIIVAPFFSGLTSDIFKDAGIILALAVVFIVIL